MSVLRRSAITAVAALSVAAARQAPDPNQPQIGLLVKGEALRQIPLAILPLMDGTRADSSSRASAGVIRDVVAADLLYSGLFSILSPSVYVSAASTNPPTRDLAALGAVGVVKGSVGVEGGNNLVVEGLLFDAKSEDLIAGKRYRGDPKLSRDIAHRIANDITIAYTGRGGVSLTRLVMVGTVGKAKEIFVMDYDGADLKQITKNGSTNVSPAWSPDGRRLAFVSYRQGTPKLYIYSGDDGSLRDASPAGSELCVAPEWSPDGRFVAFSSATGGDSEIFVLDVTTGRSRQITFNRGTDVAPSWSPSGREIAFTSDRSGRPHIYVMDAEGANVRRITQDGEYNDSAAWSPSGDRLVYVSRIDGRFEIMVREIATGAVTQLTQGTLNNENPRWSPDGRHIVFASNRSGTYRIYTMDTNGNRQEMIRTEFEATMPDWSR